MFYVLNFNVENDLERIKKSLYFYLIHSIVVFFSFFVIFQEVCADVDGNSSEQQPTLKILQNPIKEFTREMPADFTLLTLQAFPQKDLIKEIIQNIIDDKYASISYAETYKSSTNTSYNYGYHITDITDNTLTITLSKIEVGPASDMRFGGELSYIFNYEIIQEKNKIIFKINPGFNIKEIKIKENITIRKYSPLISEIDEENFIKFLEGVVEMFNNKSIKVYVIGIKSIKTTKTFEEIDNILGKRMLGPFFFPRQFIFMKTIEKLHQGGQQTRYFTKYKGKRTSVNYLYRSDNNGGNKIEVLWSMSNTCDKQKCELDKTEMEDFSDELLKDLN